MLQILTTELMLSLMIINSQMRTLQSRFLVRRSKKLDFAAGDPVVDFNTSTPTIKRPQQSSLTEALTQTTHYHNTPPTTMISPLKPALVV
jgi:hypothetical protein